MESDGIYEAKLLLWDDICDIIGPSDLWPASMVKLFWSNNPKHLDRLKMAAFSIINGLNPVVLLEWVQLMGMKKGTDSYRDLEYFCVQFDKNENKKWNHIYQWNIYNHQFEFLDGTTKYRLPFHVRPQ